MQEGIYIAGRSHDSMCGERKCTNHNIVNFLAPQNFDGIKK